MTRPIVIFIIVAWLHVFLWFLADASAADHTTMTWEEEFSQTFSPEPPQAIKWRDPRADWSWWNKMLFGSAVLTYGVGDVASTVDGLDRGCVEANPLFGENPDTGVLILGKLAVFGAGLLYTEWLTPKYWPESTQATRNWVYGTLAVMGTAVTIHNINLDCR